MKRFAALFACCTLLITTTLSGCSTVRDTLVSTDITQTQSIEASSETVSDESIKVINVYGALNEAPELVAKYRELHPDFPYKIQKFVYATADVDYHYALDTNLAAGGESIPDIYCIVSSFVPKYTKGSLAGYAATYKELGIDIDNLLKKADIAQYVIDMGTNSAGEVVALTYQGTGGAFIYRRSIAKDVWGTDDPEIIKEKIGPGWDRFIEAADELKAKGYGIVSSSGDLWRMVDNSAEMPWIVDGKLYIDPKREEFLDFAKLLKDKGYTNNTQTWTEKWYNDMKGAGDKEIFGFFGPSWFLNYVLEDNCGGDKVGEGTYGDWALCEPTLGFFWGGYWLFANKNSKHKEAIGDIIEWITLDSSETGLQSYWADGTFDFHKIPDAVTSGVVMRKSSKKLDIIGYQDMFPVFDKAAKLASGKVITDYDVFIEIYWLKQVRAYAEGSKSREEAIADFKQDVKLNLDIIVE